MEYGSSEVRKVPNLTQRWPHPDLTILTEKIERKAIPLDILRQTPHSTDRPPRFRRLRLAARNQGVFRFRNTPGWSQRNRFTKADPVPGFQKKGNHPRSEKENTAMMNHHKCICRVFCWLHQFCGAHRKSQEHSSSAVEQCRSRSHELLMKTAAVRCLLSVLSELRTSERCWHQASASFCSYLLDFC